jgi:phage terminase small subunit
VSLNDKQDRFCQEYLVDLNATRAAIRAGYSPRSAAEIGHEYLRKPQIADRISKLMAQRQERTQVTQDEVVRELAFIAFSDTRHIEMDDHGRLVLAPDAPPQAMRAVQSVKHKKRIEKGGDVVHEAEYRLWSKTDALKTLAQHLGMLRDIIEHQHKPYREAVDEVRKGLRLVG